MKSSAAKIIRPEITPNTEKVYLFNHQFSGHLDVSITGMLQAKLSYYSLSQKCHVPVP